MKAVWVALAINFLASVLVAADANVLVIGSTHPYSSGQGVKAMSQKDIESYVKTKLLRDARMRGRPNIVFEDIYRSKSIDTAVGGGGQIQQQTYSAHSLAQWYFWPEGRDDRLASLQNKGDTKWDMIVLMGDPSIMMNMPGVYAEGAALIIDAIRKGSARPLLLAPPSGDKDLISEVVCRVGMSADAPVLPAPTSITKRNVSARLLTWRIRLR